jgi:hypothetical protein
MKPGRNLLHGVAIAVLVLTAAACGKSEEKKTVGEKVGGAIDKAVDQAGQVMEKAGDVMTETGEKVKEAGEKMKEGKN